MNTNEAKQKTRVFAARNVCTREIRLSVFVDGTWRLTQPATGAPNWAVIEFNDDGNITQVKTRKSCISARRLARKLTEESRSRVEVEMVEHHGSLPRPRHGRLSR